MSRLLSVESLSETEPTTTALAPDRGSVSLPTQWLGGDGRSLPAAISEVVDGVREAFVGAASDSPSRDRHVPESWTATWPCFGGDPRRRNFALATDSGLRERPGVRWEHRRGSIVRAQPTVADDTVYTAGRDVVALDADTGTVRWETGVDGEVDGAIALSEGVAVASVTGDLHALDARTGERLWTRSGVDFGPPVADGDTLYTALDGAPNRSVAALDLQSGSTVWRSELPAGFVAGGSLDGGTLFVGVSPTDAPPQAGGLCAFDAESGEPRWSADVGVTTLPVAANAELYAVLDTGVGAENVLLSLDARTGSERWRFERSGGAPPAVTEAAVFVHEGQRLFKLDRAFGRTQWAYEPGAILDGTPVVAGETLFLATMDDDFLAVDTETGEERWRIDIPEGVNAPPTVVDGTLYVGCKQHGTVYALAADRTRMPQST